MIQWSVMRVVAVVLAAGEGRRMGGPKALTPYHGTSFLAHACRLFARPGIAAVIAVIGAEATRVRVGSRCRRRPSPSWRTTRWTEGMLSSVWRGLDAAEALGAEAVLLHPVDHPLVAPGDRGSRGRRPRTRGPSPPSRPTPAAAGTPGASDGRRSRRCAPRPPDRGARAVLAAHPEQVVHVEGDPGCRVGIDTGAVPRAFEGRS